MIVDIGTLALEHEICICFADAPDIKKVYFGSLVSCFFLGYFILFYKPLIEPKLFYNQCIRTTSEWV